MSFIPRLVIREVFLAFFFIAGICTSLMLQEWIRQPFLHRCVHELALGFLFRRFVTKRSNQPVV